MKRSVGLASAVVAILVFGFAVAASLSDDGVGVDNRANEQDSGQDAGSGERDRPRTEATSATDAPDATTAADAKGTASADGSPEGIVRAEVDEPAPVHVLATAGPVAEDAAYVLVTWDHAVSTADRYEVERDGGVVGSVAVDDESWDDTLFRDERLPAGLHTYRVRAVADDAPQPWSKPAPVRVRSTAEIGSVFEVDSYQGSDLRRAQQAVDAAESAGGGVVLFGPRTYVLDDPLQVGGDGVLLRGAGRSSTVKPHVPG